MDLAAAADVKKLDLQPHGACSRFYVFHGGFCIRTTDRIDEHGHTTRCRYQLSQQLEPLCSQLGIENIDTRQVATRPAEARNKTESDRVFSNHEDDGDRRGWF